MINLLGYLLLYPGPSATVREIAPVFGLGGALAGRVLAAPLLRRRLEPLLALGAVAAVTVLLPPLLTVTPTAARGVRPGPVPGRPPAQQRAGGLLGRGQRDARQRGAGSRSRRSGTARGRGWSALPVGDRHPALDSRANDANFLVATAPGARSAVTEPEAVAAFGQPDRRYRYHGYTIMVWRKNLLAQLRTLLASGLDPRSGRNGVVMRRVMSGEQESRPRYVAFAAVRRQVPAIF